MGFWIDTRRVCELCWRLVTWNEMYTTPEGLRVCETCFNLEDFD